MARYGDILTEGIDAVGTTSKEKALHAYPGRHNQVPRFEIDNSARFFARHLGGVATSPA